MTMATTRDPRVSDMIATDSDLTVKLRDGRSISAPLAWFPRLVAGAPEQRSRWEPAGAGTGIHWPDLDEDISVEWLLK